MERISTPIHQGTNLSPAESASLDTTIESALEVIEHRRASDRVTFVADWIKASQDARMREARS